MWLGDIVERREGLTAPKRGRITGFAPNGCVRVKLEDGQARVWPPGKIISVHSPREAEAMSLARDFVARFGEPMTDRILALLERVRTKPPEQEVNR